MGSIYKVRVNKNIIQNDKLQDLGPNKIRNRKMPNV